jgi:prepilin-type N-terminal cleavage/methylation domain-containing protein
VRRLISPAGSVDRMRGEEGFTLLEVICVVAIVAMLAAIMLPSLPRGTSRARLEAYAVETAAMLKADRNAAMRRRAPIVTEVDASECFVVGPLQSPSCGFHHPVLCLGYVMWRRDRPHATGDRL